MAENSSLLNWNDNTPTTHIKGYKVFNPDWTCKLDENLFQYSCPGIFEVKADESGCSKGFHFCKEAKDCFKYYDFEHENKVAEVIAVGKVREEDNELYTNKIKIVRKLTWHEVLTLVNTGKACTGFGNSGDNNTGNHNSGDYNSGDNNSGDYNSGFYNSGDYNSGDYNSGNHNSGDNNSGDYNSLDYNSGDGNSGTRNSGNRNSGHYNSGYNNSGDGNLGYCNSGDNNSGDYNSGDNNSGDYNSGNRNSGNRNSGDWNKASQTLGCFNTKDQKLKFFDKETDMTFVQWRNSEARYILNRIDSSLTAWIMAEDMTDAEKSEYPEHETTGGYLKTLDNLECCARWWGGLNDKEKEIIKSIPNFDPDKFYKITGIQVD